MDEFYGTLESQKSDMKVVQREKAAMKKLENVKKDHEARIAGLQLEQDSDRVKASLIEDNLELVSCINLVFSFLNLFNGSYFSTYYFSFSFFFCAGERPL